MPVRILLLVALLAVPLALGATCPGTGEDPTPSPTPTATATQAPTAKPTPTPTEPPTPTPTPMGDTLFLGGGNSWGLCFGACRFELSIVDSAVTLAVSEANGTPLFSNTGQLTAAGTSQGNQIATALLDKNLQAVYGCPDCADGGASWVDLERNGVSSSHMYEYYNPPPDLAPADVFLQDLIQALRNCVPSVNIVPDPGCSVPI